MKRVFLLMTTILLMAAASGCMQTPQEEAPPEQEPEQSQPLHLTSLSIELQRDGQNAQQLLDAVKILPQELQKMCIRDSPGTLCSHSRSRGQWSHCRSTRSSPSPPSGWTPYRR